MNIVHRNAFSREKKNMEAGWVAGSLMWLDHSSALLQIRLHRCKPIGGLYGHNG